MAHTMMKEIPKNGPHERGSKQPRHSKDLHLAPYVQSGPQALVAILGKAIMVGIMNDLHIRQSLIDAIQSLPDHTAVSLHMALPLIGNALVVVAATAIGGAVGSGCFTSLLVEGLRNTLGDGLIIRSPLSNGLSYMSGVNGNKGGTVNALCHGMGAIMLRYGGVLIQATGHAHHRFARCATSSKQTDKGKH